MAGRRKMRIGRNSAVSIAAVVDPVGEKIRTQRPVQTKVRVPPQSGVNSRQF